MLLTIGSAVLALLNLTAQFLIARHKAWGWLVSLGAQVPWTVFDLATRQYGFLLISAVSVPVYVHGWQRFRRSEEPLTWPPGRARSGSEPPREPMGGAL